MKITAVIIFNLLVLNALSQSALVKATEKSMRQVNDSLYAHETEVSNRMYTNFLEELKNNGDTAMSRQLLPDSNQWFYVGSNFLISTYHRSEKYADYPVVNISQDAAKYYCKWLTLHYNKWDDRKYKKVIFRLPANDAEWAQAARGILPFNAKYPWGKDAFQNHLGAYYCNFNRLVQNPPDTNRAAVNNGINEIVGHISRGNFLLCPVKSFAPNSIGLYNMCGNIAEMLELEKRTKGGGWDSDSKFMSINALDEYNGKTTPNPYTGFRVFMQVIEK